MSATAFMTRYRDEWIHGYEQRESLLRSTVTTENQREGNQAVFLVADSGSASTVTRGINGRIPARNDNNAQKTANLTEEHDLVRKTGFNIFASQSDQRRIMQETAHAVLNREIDSQIYTILNTGTVTLGTDAVTIPNVPLIQHAKVKLQNAEVPWDSNITLLLQPSFLSYLEEAPEFSNAEWVDMKSFAGEDMNWRDKPMAYRWKNMLVCAHPNLPGKGTTAERSFMYHKNAVGHAADSQGMKAPIGYDEEEDYTWARASMFMGGVLLQNSGIIVIKHDGSARA